MAIHHLLEQRQMTFKGAGGQGQNAVDGENGGVVPLRDWQKTVATGSREKQIEETTPHCSPQEVT